MGWVPNYNAIGKPIIECQNCGAASDLSEKITEWPLMSTARKIGLVFLSAFWGIGYGAVLMAVIALIVSYVNPAQENVSLYLVAIVIGTGLLFFIRAANTRHTSIKTSNAGRSLQRFHRRFCRR